ncbi:MAG: hypothetical protein Q4B85_12825 [Lachnospiraceae bacterium]|nr:hypothetical protein [Lachnospiraceae bacterium]
MSGLDKNRKRPYTLAFRVSAEERARIHAKIKVASIPIGEFLRQSALSQDVLVYAGKYESDRLAVELKQLRKKVIITEGNFDENQQEVLMEIKEILRIMIEKNKSL